MGPDASLEPFFGALREAAQDLGVEAWIVGGYVRDAILGRAEPDLDVVVSNHAAEVAGKVAEALGLAPPVLFPRFGTAQLSAAGRRFEFATARSESYSSNSRKPAVRRASILDDLLRRDFTVNALLMDLDGRVVDRVNGLVDLEQGLLRTPRDPDETFADDPLRMLRAIRFVAQLGFRLDPALLPAMRRQRHRVQPPVLSPERVAEELKKILASERPRLALELMDEAGLLNELLPELTACKGVRQGGYHIADVFGHTLLALQHSPPPLVVRLAVLLHDIGKPSTSAPDGSFHGHEKVGSELTRVALERLRFANVEVNQVAKLVALHLRPVYYRPDWTDGAVRRLAHDAGEAIGPLMDLARADVAASAYPHPEWMEELDGRIQAVLQERPSRLDPPFDGEDVMRIRGLAPGPEVGRLKKELGQLIMEGTLAPEREAILEYLATNPGL